jgi:short-subunit dehydrogenase
MKGGNMKKSLYDKYGPWALVTGASAGIGAAFARRLAREKFHLILVARRIDKLTALKDELEKACGIQVLPVAGDLGASDFLPGLVQAVGDREVGLLVNNAGYGINGSFLDHDPSQEANMLAVNCRAPLLLTHHFSRPMKARGRGGIVFLSSIGANQPTPLSSTYAATKVFDLFLGEGLTYELKPFGIDVVSVLPGVTRTEFQEVGNYRVSGHMRTAENVVNTALNALGRKSSATDGFGNKMMTFFSRRLPRSVVIRQALKVSEKWK